MSDEDTNQDVPNKNPEVPLPEHLFDFDVNPDPIEPVPPDVSETEQAPNINKGEASKALDFFAHDSGWSLEDFFEVNSKFLIFETTTMSNPPQSVTINNTYKVEFHDRDRFNGQHFDIWMIRVRTILQELKLWDLVTGVDAKPAAAAAAEVKQAWDLKDLKARNVIQSALDLSMMTHERVLSNLCKSYLRLSFKHNVLKKKASSLLSTPQGIFTIARCGTPTQ